MNREICVAISDGMRECELAAEIPSRHACEFHVAHVPPLTRVFTRAHERGLLSCHDVQARFFLLNETGNAESASSPHYKEIWTGTFDASCALNEPDFVRGALGVFEIQSNVSRDVTFFRKQLARPFDTSEFTSTWTGEGTEIRVELDLTYAYPACCDLPLFFVDRANRVWTQIAYESQSCNEIDAAEYAHFSTQPDRKSAYNSTHDRYTFVVTADVPCNYSAGLMLFSQTEVHAYVPLTKIAPQIKLPPRFLNAVMNDQIVDPAIWVSSSVIGVFVLVFAFTIYAQMRAHKPKE